MSEPTLYDFALIKYGEGASPTEVFTQLCGITGVQISETAETQSRRVRDCAKPNKPGVRRIKVIGVDWTISGTGVTNADQRAVIKSTLLGKKVNYQVEYYRDDDTDGGELLGTDAGTAIMTTNTMNIDVEAATTTMEITLEGEGDLVYTPAGS